MNVMSTDGAAEITMLGWTKAEWLDHIEMLFSVAHPGEDIPQAALLYAWPGKPKQEDIEWAHRQLAAVPPEPKVDKSHE